MELNNCIVDNCLTPLVGIRSTCPGGACAPFFVEDLEGVTLESLADTAQAGVSGEQYAKDLINTGARIFLGDIEMFASSGYNLINSFGELCSTCTFLPAFQSGGGVRVRNLIISPFSTLKITKIEVLTNGIGQQNLVFDDGKKVVKFPFVAMGAYEITPVVLKYETLEPSVKISLEDSSLGMGFIECAKGGGCGCNGGGGGIPKDTVLTFSGLLAGNDVTQQYGFKICASVVCSSDLLTCSMVRQTPNIFGLTLLYKIGALYYANSPLTTRLNRNAGFNTEEKQTMQDYYETLYRQRLNGTSNVKGLRVIIADYLKKNQDKCMVCNTAVVTAWVTG